MYVERNGASEKIYATVSTPLTPYFGHEWNSGTLKEAYYDSSLRLLRIEL